MKFALDIDPSSPADLNAAVALLVKLGAIHTPTANGEHLLVPMPPAAALDPQDSPDAGLELITPESAFASAPPAADLAEAVAAFEQTLPNAPAPAIPSTPPAGTPPAPPNGAQTDGAPTLVNGVEVDRHGLPWDNRIHAGTKSKIKDGSWTAKRGRDENTVHAIEQELRALMAVPSPAAAIAPPPGVAAGIAPPPPAAIVAPAQTPLSAAGAPGPATPVQPAAAGAPINFGNMLQKIAVWVEREGVLTQEDVAQACQAVGVPSLPLAALRPDLLAQIDLILEATVAQRRSGV